MSRYVIIAAALVVVFAVAAQTQAGTVVSPGAPLPVGGMLVNPNYPGSTLLGQSYNTYTGGGAGWQFVRGMKTDFASTNVPGLNGTLESQAWKNLATGQHTFIYQVTNTGTRMLRSGNIYGYDPARWDVIDAGVMHFGGSTAYVNGDVLAMSRSNSGIPQVSFSFQALAMDNGVFSVVEELLAPGQQSNWFYYSTDAPGVTVGYAGVIDSGATADHIRALIPIPEPTTMMAVFAGIAGIGGYLRRRLG